MEQNTIDLSGLSRDQLRQRCRELGIKRYSLMNNDGMKKAIYERLATPGVEQVELVRADDGSGGWSLHDSAGELLTSGPSEAAPNGEWLRPDAADYATTIAPVVQLPTMHAQRVRRLSDQIHIRDGKRPLFKRYAVDRALSGRTAKAGFLLERNGFAVLPSNGRKRKVDSSWRTPGRIKRSMKRDAQRSVQSQQPDAAESTRAQKMWA